MRRQSFPVPHQRLRQLCLEGAGLSRQEREFWWPVLVRADEGEDTRAYPNPQLAHARLVDAAKSTGIQPLGDGTLTIIHVFHVIIRKFGIQEPKYIRRLFRLISDEMASHPFQAAVVYCIFESICSKNNKFMQMTMLDLHIKERIFVQLLQQKTPKTYEKLVRIKAIDTQYLHQIFFVFFDPLFTKDSIVRVIDIYLLEGAQSIFKYALALISSHKADIKAPQTKSALECWKLFHIRKSHPGYFQTIHQQAYSSALGSGRQPLFEISEKSLLKLYQRNLNDFKITPHMSRFDKDDMELAAAMELPRGQPPSPLKPEEQQEETTTLNDVQYPQSIAETWVHHHHTKIVMLGDSHSGKSCLLHRFVHGEYAEVPPTIGGIDF